MVINIPTKIFFGKEELTNLVNDLNNEKVLLVTGKSKRVLNTDVVKALLNLFDSNNIQHFVYSNVTTNPTKEQVDLGIKMCKENNCTAIVGIGGGSVIDVSKAISFSGNNDDFWSFVENPRPDKRCFEIINYKYFFWNRKRN